MAPVLVTGDQEDGDDTERIMVRSCPRNGEGRSFFLRMNKSWEFLYREKNGEKMKESEFYELRE